MIRAGLRSPLINAFLGRSPVIAASSQWSTHCLQPSLRHGGITTKFATPPSRSYVMVFYPELDDKEDVSEMAVAAEEMGADAYPYHRKERLRPQDIRKMKANRASGKASVKKVNAVVQLINYRRARKTF